MWEPGTIGNINLTIIPEFTARYYTVQLLSTKQSNIVSIAVLDAQTSLMSNDFLVRHQM